MAIANSIAIPFNVLDLAQAFILNICQKTDIDWGWLNFGDLLETTTLSENLFVTIRESSEPPWHHQDICDVLKPGQKRQCLILSETLSPFTTATVMMAVEQGLRVFVCSDDAAEQFINVTRLVQASATVLTPPQLIAELLLGQFSRSSGASAMGDVSDA